MIGRLLGRGLAGLALAIGLGFIGTLLAAHPASAAGEVYTWKDARTISVTGPDLIGASDLKLLDGTILTGDMSAVFGGDLLYRNGTSGCTVSISLYLFKTTGDKEGRVWNPPPYDNAEAGGANSTPRCYLDGRTDLDPAIHDKWAQISGTRPDSGGAPERAEEKAVSVFVYAPDPLSTAPRTDTIYIYNTAGQLVKSQTAPFEDDSGAVNWPANQTPVALRVTFSLEPGDYIVCDTYVAKACAPAQATAAQKFTKVQYKTMSVSLGKQFQTPDKMRITGHINVINRVPCGSTVSLSPMLVELIGPDGTINTTQSNSGSATPAANEAGQVCTKEVTISLTAYFENMQPGVYKACAAGASQCVNVTKVDGAGAEFTIVVDNELTAPPDQQVCTTGEGAVGALSWVICPLTQMIASATDFFEKNIIIPFLTVSPLTTSNQNPIYILWQRFRDLANIGFIIMLFVSIFSIIFSKFGMKRLLPRLLIVAVGINLSYFAVALVIDMFNIFGAGVAQLVTAALQQAGVTQLNTGTSAGPLQSMFVLGGGALLTIVLTGGAALGWLFSFLGLAALIIVVVVLVLIIRQLAIIVLVVISPLAILMYLLPNTEGQFKKWRTNLFKLLLMYPMIVLLFAAGKIFGIVLQQPDFNIAGDGVNEDVAQGVRVILQFMAYVIPLVLLPATFAASGTLMQRAYGAFQRRAIARGVKRLKEDTSHMGREAQMRMARSKIPGLNSVAGRSLRRDRIREDRARNLAREQEDYVARAAGSSAMLRSSAAGVAGQAGRTRAAAYAAGVAAKGMNEDIDNEMALLNDEMRRVGLDEETFAEHTAAYLQDPTDPTKRVITGSNGQTFDFAANAPRLQRALLNSAAAQGEAGAIEAARLNPEISQELIDVIVSRNDAPLKGGGGYHLATNFNLGHGRDYDTSTSAGRDAASVDMHARRISAMANSGERSIVNMKYGMLMNTEEILNPTAGDTDGEKHRDAVLASLSDADKKALRDKLASILSPRNRSTLAEADVSRETLDRIMSKL